VARVRWYEAAALANAALVAGLIVGRSGVAFDVPASVRAQLPMLGVSAALLAAGVGLRALLVAAGSGASRSRLYLSRIASPRSLSELARFALAFTLVAYGYSWLKVFVPRLHATVFDPALAVLDQLLHFGLNPNRFAVELFPYPAFYRFLDLYYAQFFATLLFAVAWFGSALSIRERTRFAAGLAVSGSAAPGGTSRRPRSARATSFRATPRRRSRTCRSRPGRSASSSTSTGR